MASSFQAGGSNRRQTVGTGNALQIAGVDPGKPERIHPAGAGGLARRGSTVVPSVECERGGIGLEQGWILACSVGEDAVMEPRGPS